MWPERWQRLVPRISYRKGLAIGLGYTIISTLRFLFLFSVRREPRGPEGLRLATPLRTRTSLRPANQSRSRYSLDGGFIGCVYRQP
jgi:hypothetical protein